MENPGHFSVEINNSMTINAYLNLTGSVLGKIEGSVSTPGHQGSIRVLEYRHELVSPHDPGSNMPTGRRQHAPLIVLKEIDRSSPLLKSCLVANEDISNWNLGLWRAGPGGREVRYHSIELTHARVVSVRSEFVDAREIEHVAFTYKSIRWTIAEGGISAEDSWIAPVA
jgi:type VI secretion system secreted protein Hcp